MPEIGSRLDAKMRMEVRRKIKVKAGTMLPARSRQNLGRHSMNRERGKPEHTQRDPTISELFPCASN